MREVDPVTEWLWDNAGPIIRWRMARDWGFPAPESREELRGQLLATKEVRRWLGNLGGRQVHGSKDTDAENPMAKLVEYGLRKGIPEFDSLMLPYAETIEKRLETHPDDVLHGGAPFLIAAGYTDHMGVRRWFQWRLEILHPIASAKRFDIYAPANEARCVPKAWRGKPVYRPEYFAGRVVRLPTCYDLYAMAYWATPSAEEQRVIRDIMAYVAHPRFQNTPGGYLWQTERNTCYAAGKELLACLTEQREVLFLDLMARFAECREQSWFITRIGGLEKHRTPRGTYKFPSGYLPERRNGYYIYAGAHQGLGENRRNRNWSEIESTFRMLNIRRLMNT